MSYLEKAKQILSGAAAIRARCRRCLALEAEGVEVLRCFECSYVHPPSFARQPLPRHPPRIAGGPRLRLVKVQRKEGRKGGAGD